MIFVHGTIFHFPDGSTLYPTVFYSSNQQNPFKSKLYHVLLFLKKNHVILSLKLFPTIHFSCRVNSYNCLEGPRESGSFSTSFISHHSLLCWSSHNLSLLSVDSITSVASRRLHFLLPLPRTSFTQVTSLLAFSFPSGFCWNLIISGRLPTPTL